MKFRTKERYKRNIAIDSIGEAGQQKLLTKKVLIAGAGGLGSGVITNLVSAGIGTIGIIDYDTVEASNLNRQFIHAENSIDMAKTESAYKWIKQYSPDTEVKIYKTRVDAGMQYDFFKEYDLVVDCFDSFRSKFDLNRICVELDLPLVHGGVGEFSGQVFTIIPGKSMCLQCMFDPDDANADTPKGIISPTVNLIASIQAMEAVKFLLGFDDLLFDKMLTYNGMSQEFRKISLIRSKDCTVCKKLCV